VEGRQTDYFLLSAFDLWLCGSRLELGEQHSCIVVLRPS
jgi:hypothetical protein